MDCREAKHNYGLISEEPQFIISRYQMNEFKKSDACFSARNKVTG